ncbi:hypothetical protein CAEBREN_01398 [Caenorhabditis brenneri]|uniref:Uncharacterized protein n=1 Tax=Caenorhabditis brenneri TaxID=135651 RepID=G0NXD7_CAEBE|nr:hypothetical protein CAEBREN_01398 [Caenorhabditis brenneri]
MSDKRWCRKKIETIASLRDIICFALFPAHWKDNIELEVLLRMLELIASDLRSLRSGLLLQGRRHNYITIAEQYRRDGYRLRYPDDRLVYIEGASTQVYAVEWLSVLKK